jgi:hypothetical protein
VVGRCWEHGDRHPWQDGIHFDVEAVDALIVTDTDLDTDLAANASQAHPGLLWLERCQILPGTQGAIAPASDPHAVGAGDVEGFIWCGGDALAGSRSSGVFWLCTGGSASTNQQCQ